MGDVRRPGGRAESNLVGRRWEMSAVEGLLERLHTPDGESPERLRAYLDLAAEALGLLRDPGTAEIVRRRAAAA